MAVNYRSFRQRGESFNPEMLSHIAYLQDGLGYQWLGTLNIWYFRGRCTGVELFLMSKAPGGLH